MPKMKTHKGIAKRVRVSKNGKVLRNRVGRRHLMSHKSSKVRRRLRKVTKVNANYANTFLSRLKKD
ncbi:MAG: 50S ribosomal protein L35 [Candidatus Brocadiae bacterium]|nr:50S ribosomal protein L35 [Candidatus Brocadiia bacterium]